MIFFSVFWVMNFSWCMNCTWSAFATIVSCYRLLLFIFIKVQHTSVFIVCLARSTFLDATTVLEALWNSWPLLNFKIFSAFKFSIVFAVQVVLQNVATSKDSCLNLRFWSVFTRFKWWGRLRNSYIIFRNFKNFHSSNNSFRYFSIINLKLMAITVRCKQFSRCFPDIFFSTFRFFVPFIFKILWQSTIY